jgi:hypothetical protein
VTWRYHDGGRAVAGFRGEASDCVTRALAIALGRPYDEIYALVNREVGRTSRRRRRRSSARTGLLPPITRQLMVALGWRWTPTMRIGSGTTVHLRPDELPGGLLVVKLSGHVACVRDGVVLDTHDPSRGGTRAVYGYWQPGPGQVVHRSRERVSA